MTTIIKYIDGLNKLLRYLCALLLAVMSVAVVFQVVIRFAGKYIDVEMPDWSEELARYCMIWLVFLGTALAVRYSALIGVEAIVERLNPTLKRIVRVLVTVITMIFFFILVYYGFEMLGHVSAQESPSLRIPMSIPYAALPISGIFMLINAIAVLLETIVGKDGQQKEVFSGSE
ncbi:TRAP transporter small permease [Paenibacillus naphthalenovorans]|uniref:TRAP transporter small permease n=1 Tax=Paenibacillus naphthalenovorans TaxID=162209 RepID=UPI0010B659C9|nr:TRAP transporter small permease [Paenibacillus naphthalenovorans]GCL74044.1 TRAP transporter small permease [Paenibacillus naphthalenovorans]